MSRRLFRLTAMLVLGLWMSEAGVARARHQEQVEAELAKAGPGTRFGMVVTTQDGRELIAIAPDQRFIPASNTKMFPTAAAFEAMSGLDEPDTNGGAEVRLERQGERSPDVVLTGNGDARLSSMSDCIVNCLATLADAVAAKTNKIDDVIGDDSLFPDQRWSLGMSWNNIPTADGTAISALTLDDNQIALLVTPGIPGRPPRVALLPYFRIENRAITIASGQTALALERLPGERSIQLTGTIAAGAAPEQLRAGIDDPAHYAAWRLKHLLEARGVKVTGSIETRHRRFAASDDPKVRGIAPPARPVRPQALARLTPPPLSADLVRINKASLNLHAELLLRRLGLIAGSGSTQDGHRVIEAMLLRAGVPRTGFDFADGSGMSTYNRLAPRAVVTFLRWVAAQPWGAAWRATLPIAGKDGTLRKRFMGTALEGRLVGKTGSLNATYALAGYLTARSGRTLVFSIFANDAPETAAAREAMDAALGLVAEQN